MGCDKFSFSTLLQNCDGLSYTNYVLHTYVRTYVCIYVHMQYTYVYCTMMFIHAQYMLM